MADSTAQASVAVHCTFASSAGERCPFRRCRRHVLVPLIVEQPSQCELVERAGSASNELPFAQEEAGELGYHGLRAQVDSEIGGENLSTAS